MAYLAKAGKCMHTAQPYSLCIQTVEDYVKYVLNDNGQVSTDKQ